eukprot:259037-Prymnesium_polylepis.1
MDNLVVVVRGDELARSVQLLAEPWRTLPATVLFLSPRGGRAAPPLILSFRMRGHLRRACGFLLLPLAQVCRIGIIDSRCPMHLPRFELGASPGGRSPGRQAAGCSAIALDT